MDLWLWSILLLLLGTCLAIMEIFFPSAGILGFLSAVAVLAAVVMGFYENALVGSLILLGAVIGLPTAIVLGFKYWPKTAIGRRVLLMAPESKDVLPDDAEKEFFQNLIGQVGRAKSKMLLSGVIVIDGRTVDAVSESQPIEIGEAVRVVQVRGHKVVVRPIEEQTAVAPPDDPRQRVYDDPFELPPA